MPLGLPVPSVPGLSYWKVQAMSRALQVDPSMNLMTENDYDTSSESSTFTFLTGTVSYDTGVTGGVVKLKTGALGTAEAMAYNSGGSFLVGSPINESWYVQARCWMKTKPIGETEYFCVGLADRSAQANRQYVAFGLIAQEDDTFLTLNMNAATGSIYSVTSRFAADLTTFHDYGIGRDVVNDKVYALVDGMPVLELDGPFELLTTKPCFCFSGVIADSGLGQNVELWADNIATVVKQAA
jgi:hypothetical protein